MNMVSKRLRKCQNVKSPELLEKSSENEEEGMVTNASHTRISEEDIPNLLARKKSKTLIQTTFSDVEKETIRYFLKFYPCLYENRRADNKNIQLKEEI